MTVRLPDLAAVPAGNGSGHKRMCQGAGLSKRMGAGIIRFQAVCHLRGMLGGQCTRGSDAACAARSTSAWRS
jgi:hypothetical protein